MSFTIDQIYQGVSRLITEIIAKEARAQGHYLTGRMNDSFGSQQTKKGASDILEGIAVDYTYYVNRGLPPEKASFKQVPFLIEYFLKLGFPVYASSGQITATGMAFATVQKWMKEGAPTQASKKYSSTGSRTNFVENAMIGNESKIDEYMGNTFDFAMDEVYDLDKSETI